MEAHPHHTWRQEFALALPTLGQVVGLTVQHRKLYWLPCSGCHLVGVVVLVVEHHRWTLELGQQLALLRVLQRKVLQAEPLRSQPLKGIFPQAISPLRFQRRSFHSAP